MSDDRLPTHLQVGAVIRTLNLEAVPAVVLQKGEPQSGVILLKLNMFAEGCRMLIQARDMDGRLGWMNVFREERVGEDKADAYIARATHRDPDLWVLEIEDRKGENPFEGPFIG